jgi:hypothetical protein
MKLEDLDFALQHENGSVRLSELNKQDMDQIRTITKSIMMQKIFDDEYKAILAAFFVYTESFVECNESISNGGYLN